MTGCAGVRGVGCFGVTGSAIEFTLLTVVEWEAVLAQPCRQPCLVGVAVGAIDTKYAQMNGWLRVTTNTIGWGASKCLVDVACCAFLHGVLPAQRPYLVMVEWNQIATAIVTALAICTKQSNVCGQEVGNGRFMAVYTHHIRHLDWICTFVATLAGK